MQAEVVDLALHALQVDNVSDYEKLQGAAEQQGTLAEFTHYEDILQEMHAQLNGFSPAFYAALAQLQKPQVD